MIPLPRPSLPPGACQSCGLLHSATVPCEAAHQPYTWIPTLPDVLWTKPAFPPPPAGNDGEDDGS
jgi:hypothetical protein